MVQAHLLGTLRLVYYSHFQSVPLKLRRDTTKLKSQNGSNSSRPVSILLSPGQRKGGKGPGPNLGFLFMWPPGCALLLPYLEQCSSHVEDDEDEGEGGVPALHTADGVEEH